LRQVAGKSGMVRVALMLAALLPLAAPVGATDLEPQTIQAFDHYVQITESQIDSQPAQGDPFLWAERLPEGRRAEALSQLRAGEVVIARLDSLLTGSDADRGSDKPVSVPGGLIHHWIGTVFVPGATLAQTLAFEEDYAHHEQYFRPDVMRSRVLRHDGQDFLIELRLYKKKVITTVLDTDHEVHYTLIDSTHASSHSKTTRIQEVDNPGAANERLEPMGHDRGFLWRMNTYWRFEERDGGTYVECQSISLTRDIPAGLGWMIGPYVNSVPRESLTFTLATTRSAIPTRIASDGAQ
jgi:hypothetical protein